MAEMSENTTKINRIIMVTKKRSSKISVLEGWGSCVKIPEGMHECCKKKKQKAKEGDKVSSWQKATVKLGLKIKLASNSILYQSLGHTQ